LDTDLKTKYKKLTAIIHSYNSAVVAFSGGADSTLLAFAAAEALGPDNVLCVTARAASFPERELKEAETFCAGHGIRHEILEFDEFDVEGFAANPPDRCYLCKRALFSMIKELAEKEGIPGEKRAPVVLEGSNLDDDSDYRPGMKAISELGVKSPLRDAGLAKDDIREILKALGLQAWDKQPFACLATRFVYGEEITKEKLDMVGRAEQYLLDLGFAGVRARIHGERVYTARIEARPDDIALLAAEPLRGEISGYFKDVGFEYVTLDLTGYRKGSMNTGLPQALTITKTQAVSET